MLKKSRVVISYQMLVIWRKLVYRRLLLNRYLSNYSVLWLKVLASVMQYFVCITNRNNGNTWQYMESWKEQTSALFAPELTPISAYANSTTDARIALDQLDLGSSGKLIFFSHGAFLMQNVSSLLAEISLKSSRPIINVLLFRRQSYPHIEEWWKSYSLCFRINLVIVKNDSMQLIDMARSTLENNDIVLCAPDYFFSNDINYAEGVDLFEKTSKIFMHLGKSKNADVFYVNCCNTAKFDDSRSIVTKIEKYNFHEVKALFEQELLRNPNHWFFSYNHYCSIESWGKS